jgi:hypothetical protein
MREHYRDMSYGAFDLQGGVLGWYDLPALDRGSADVPEADDREVRKRVVGRDNSRRNHRAPPSV